VDRHIFRDRQSAGVRLGAAVSEAELDRPVVLGLPRGGIPVAAEVAAALSAPLDVIVVRKLGVPYQPELAMGAIGEDGVLIVNHGVILAAHVSEHELSQVESRERGELDRRLRRVRAVRPRESLVGRSAVLVDDGIATGATMRAAIRVARAHGAKEVTVATPVAPPEVVQTLRSEADRIVCLEQPDPFWAVGSWYRDFSAVSDDEVVELITAAMVPPDPPTGGGSAAGSTASPNPALPVREVAVPIGALLLVADLAVPDSPMGLVVFAHGSGSSRHSPRNRWVAERLHQVGLATALVDLLTPQEARLRENVFHVDMLADRLDSATHAIRAQPDVAGLPVGYFGASTGAAAALHAAAEASSDVAAVVSRGGRPDLAGPHLADVRAPTLLIVGSDDHVVVELNREAAKSLRCEHKLLIVPGATHLFEEPGALERVADAAAMWFGEHLSTAAELSSTADQSAGLLGLA
jgi:putative phosphoribosyl transferase